MDGCCNPGNKPSWRKVFNMILFQYSLEILGEQQKYGEVCVSETAMATYQLLVTVPPILKFGTLYLLFTLEFCHHRDLGTKTLPNMVEFRHLHHVVFVFFCVTFKIFLSAPAWKTASQMGPCRCPASFKATKVRSDFTSSLNFKQNMPKLKKIGEL